MGKKYKSSKLETYSDRLDLEIRRKPHWLLRLAPGLTLGYRRVNGPVGTWNVRIIKDGKESIKVIGLANDRDGDVADGKRVLDFDQACLAARMFAFGESTVANLSTLDQALTEYEANLKARQANPYNARWVRNHLKKSNPALLDIPVRMITADELTKWRDSLTKMTPANWNRLRHALRAALELAASDRSAVWKKGLAKRPGGAKVRNVVLDDQEVRAVVGAAYLSNPALGLLARCWRCRRARAWLMRSPVTSNASTS
jgi:hypothetical protein